MSEFLLISDAAREVQVESHVLRYWEEELHLPIKRNELGHRYYTEEDVKRFKQIKSMKERGLQLKAIKMILKDGRLDVLPQEDTATDRRSMEPQGEYRVESPSGLSTDSYGENVQGSFEEPCMSINIIDSRTVEREVAANNIVNDREDKSKRLQWLLQQLIKETLLENNQELCREIKESVVKELDYQFRAQEEREDERDRRQNERNEEYYKKMDELLRTKSRFRKRKKEKNKSASMENTSAEQKKVTSIANKKKRHFLF